MTKENKKNRLEEINKELAELKEQYQIKKAEREQAKDQIQHIKTLQEQIKQLEHEAELAEKQTDYTQVAEIRYAKLPKLEKELLTLEEKNQKDKASQDIVIPEDIAEIVAKWTGVPIAQLVANEIEKLSNLESWIQKRVVGQNNATQLVANAIRRSRAGLKDPNRPIGSFLFLGPTGVGKTELAKALAESLFDDEKAIIRIDMSEYMEKHAVARLIGSPPGYIGHEEGGQLTEAVRRKPYAVILFDEIEKAHPEVFNLLLQMLDDGRLTDSKGKTVDFKNTIIIMTSNIGSEFIFNKIQNSSQNEERDIQKELEKKLPKKNQQQKIEDNTSPILTVEELMPILLQHFRPEFLNRIDDIVIFNPLSQEVLEKIVDIQIDSYLKKLLGEREISIDLTKTAKAFIVEKGWNPQFGARPLKRAIQTYLLDKIALDIIEGNVQNGDHIKVDFKN